MVTPTTTPSSTKVLGGSAAGLLTRVYPKIGEELPFATETLKMLIKEHHKLILWTVREGALLDEAVNWCRERGVEFYAINKDYPEERQEWNNHFSRKLKVDMWIDDRNIGGLPDWGQIYQMIHYNKTWHDIMREERRSLRGENETQKKKHWWQF